jgi:2,4-dienoyl-CoA reductase-like NADH-dependent reductase (Old Yellow Enzyme family)
MDLSTQGLRKPEHIINPGQADAIPMAREFLREPYWPLRTARELGQTGLMARAISPNHAERCARACSR